MAIDGLRIALLAGMIFTLLRMLRLARAWCGVIAIPIIWFYTAATGWEHPTIRASGWSRAQGCLTFAGRRLATNE